MNVEEALIAYLPTVLGVPAFGETPEERPESFVVVDRTGGPTELVRDIPSLAVQWWADNKADACTLSVDGRAALRAFVNEDDIMKVEIGSTYSFPDPESSQARYQTTCTITTA